MSKKVRLLVLIFTVLFAVSLFKVPTARAMTIEELRAEIVKLQQQLAQYQEQLEEAIKEEEQEVWCYNFKSPLRHGDRGTEVEALQTALEKEGFSISSSEKSMNYFGDFTASAVVEFQEKYASDILTPWKLRRGTGFVGETTRAKLNEIYGCEVVSSYIKVISPNGGEQWDKNKSYEITWDSSGISSETMIKIVFKEHGAAGGMITKTPNTGSYTWDIDKTSVGMGQTISLGDEYQIEMCSVEDDPVCDKSDRYFSIVSIEQEDLVSGTLSVNKTEVNVGENIELTVTGQDDNGLIRLWAYYQDNWHYVGADGTSFENTWTFSESKPGTYAYKGYLNGKKADGSNQMGGEGESAYTTPSSVTVRVAESVVKKPNLFIYRSMEVNENHAQFMIGNNGNASANTFMTAVGLAELATSKTINEVSLMTGLDYQRQCLYYQNYQTDPLNAGDHKTYDCDYTSVLKPNTYYAVKMETDIGNDVSESNESDNVRYTTFKTGDKKTPPCDSYGDSNADGYVTQEDVTACEEYIASNAGGTIVDLCDVDGNGTINALDITKIERYIVGLDSTFPVCAEKEDPVSGTLSVNKTEVNVGENIELTVTGQDDNGLIRLWAYYQDSWHYVGADGTSFENTWTFSESKPGTYTYEGYLNGKKADGSNQMGGEGESAYTTPKTVTVIVTESVTSKPDLIITDVSFQTDKRVHYTIKNQGNNIAPYSNSNLYVDGVSNGIDYVQSLSAGQSNNESFSTWTCTPGTSYEIQVAADAYFSHVSESNEDNNFKTETLTCPGEQASITVISPNGGEKFGQGSNLTIAWDSSGVDYVNIDLLDYGRTQEDGSTPFVLDLANNYSASASGGMYTWKIYSDWPTGNLYKVRVENAGKEPISDTSDNYFSIVSAEKEDPVSGTLSVNKTEVNVGETIELTVTGQDDNGLTKLWAYYQGSWHYVGADGTSFENTWTFSESKPGNYTYKGYVNGKKVSGSTESTYTTPSSVTVRVTEEQTCTDSDGGKDYYTKGTVVEYKPDGTWAKDTDECWGTNNQLLKEVYCQDGKLVADSYVKCPYGCEDGACLREPEKSITVTSPNGGERWEIGKDYWIRWNSEGIDSVDVMLERWSNYGAGGPETWVIMRNVSAAGSLEWKVGSHNNEYIHEITSGEYKIYIVDSSESSISDRSNANFTIVSAEQEDLVSGELLLGCAPTVQVGGVIQLIVNAQDNQGIDTISVYYKGSWHAHGCNGANTCAWPFEFQEEEPGTYIYYGYVYGRRLDGKLEGFYTEPRSITVTVTEKQQASTDKNSMTASIQMLIERLSNILKDLND